MITAGQNLQAAINAAPLGATLVLEAGAVWEGNFTTPYGLTLVSSAPLARGPIDPITSLPTLRTPNAAPALRILGSNMTLRGVRLAAANTDDLVILGDPLTTHVNDQPANVWLDRCDVRVDQTAKRGVQLNSRETR